MVPTNSSNAPEIVHAKSHPIVRINSKRLEHSPYVEKYADEHTIFAIYANQLYPVSLGEDVIEHYWKLRRDVMLYDTPEKPIDIQGPDAVALLQRVFTRRIDDLKTWRAHYAIACTAQGGILDYDTDIDGEHHDCKIVSLPFYDAEKKISWGLEVAEI